MAKIGRNDPCPCGSGKKYKRCCLEKDETAERKFAATERTFAATASVPQRQIGTVAAEIAERLAAAASEIDEPEDDLPPASHAPAHPSPAPTPHNPPPSPPHPP